MSTSMVKRIQAAERKRLRDADMRSLFKRRTLNIYRHQLLRLREVAKKLEVAAPTIDKMHLPYTRDELRATIEFWLPNGCHYCRCKITAKNFTVDHANPVYCLGGDIWTLANLRVTCRKCNWRKGILREAQYLKLVAFVNDVHNEFSEDERANLWARLVIGGKWHPR